MWVSKNVASKGHDVTLISARGSSVGEGGGEEEEKDCHPTLT